MVGRTQVSSTVTEPTIPELVNSLKSAYEKAAFTRVEEALFSREEKLKKEIEKKNEENKLLQEKLHTEVLEKLKLQKECEELKGEKEGLSKRLTEKGAEKQIIELKNKNFELLCAKLKAETTVEIRDGSMKVLEEKLSILEKELNMPDEFRENGEAVNTGIEKDGLVYLPSNSNAGKNKVSQKVERRLETGKFSSDENVLSKTNSNPSTSLSHSKRTGKNKASKEVKSTLETGMVGSNEKPLSETNQNPGGSSSHRKIPDRRRPLPEQIVEISDSDDEAAPSERQDSRGTVTEGQMDQSDSRKTVAENDPAVHKRALASSLDVDGNCPVENSKRVKIQEHAPFAPPIEHRSTPGINLETSYSKKYTSLELERLLNESSSSSSSDDDDDLDLTVDYSTFIRTDDSAYQNRD